MTNQEMRSNILSMSKKDKMVGRQNSQKALHASFPIQSSQFLRKGDRSFQVIWRKDLDVNLKTQNYCVELLALYLHRMIIQIQYYFDDWVSLCGSCSAETTPSHGPHGKSFNLLQNYSLPVCEKSFLTRKEYAICRSPCQIETYSLG